MYRVSDVANDYTHLHRNSPCDTFKHTYKYIYQHTDKHVHGYSYSDGNLHCYILSNGWAFADFHQYPNALLYAVSYRDSFEYCDTYQHLYGNSCRVGKHLHLCGSG